MQQRRQWCQEHPVAGRKTAFLNEKWWRTFRRKTKIYRRSQSPLLYEHLLIHSPGAMFIGVFSSAAPCGKVGL